MRILGIETSCDETAAAVVEDGTKILSSAVASSEALHQKTGGIIPEIAAREQVKCIIPVIEETLPKNKEIDALAVTIGPGLVGSLLVGIETAKTLAYAWKKPLIPINHLQAHLYATWLEGEIPDLPAVGLVVSGGHTDLVLMKNHQQLKWLGGTRDDAAGECFDKTARVLGLPYPGGPAIAKLAEKGNPETYDLPRPMLNQDNFDFSFSGLKTAVINLVKKEREIKKADLAASIQKAIVDILVKKATQAAETQAVKSLILGGGVAANRLLKEELNNRCQQLGIKLYVASPKLCTDNGAVIASCASFNFKPISWQKIQVKPSLGIEEMVK